MEELNQSLRLGNIACEMSRWQLIKRQLNNLAPEGFARAIEQTSDAVILDVRTPVEFSEGAIPNAKNLNYLGEEFLDHLEKLDPSKTYFIYCRTSRRSIRTYVLMKNSGFRKLYNLDGGWMAWKEFWG